MSKPMVLEYGAFIGDGYDETFYIAAEPRLYPAVRGTYRPMLVEERNQLLEENRAKPPHQATRNTARVLATKISSWDIKGAGGTVTPPSAEAIGKLKPRLYERILGLVMGLDPSDEDPEAPPSEAEKSQGLADQLEAEASKRQVGDVAAERAAKNS